MVGHLPYYLLHTYYHSFKNISQDYVSHRTELGDRPELEEDLNFHFYDFFIEMCKQPHIIKTERRLLP